MSSNFCSCNTLSMEYISSQLYKIKFQKKLKGILVEMLYYCFLMCILVEMYLLAWVWTLRLRFLPQGWA